MSRAGSGRGVSGETLRFGFEPFPAPLAAEPESPPLVADRRPRSDAVDDHAAHEVVRVLVVRGRGEELAPAPLAAEAHGGPVVHARRLRGRRVRQHAAHGIVGARQAGSGNRIAEFFAGIDGPAPALPIVHGKRKPSSCWKVNDAGRCRRDGVRVPEPVRTACGAGPRPAPAGSASAPASAGWRTRGRRPRRSRAGSTTGSKVRRW